MAVVRCILSYDGKQLTKTFQIAFDKSDKLEIYRATEDLAVKGRNATARNVLNNLMKKGKAKASQALRQSKVSKGTKGVYALPPAPAVPQKKGNGKAVAPAVQPSICFSSATTRRSVFQCGYLENGKFTPYTGSSDGLEFPTPP